MKKVTILGNSYEIAYNFATVLAYEDEFDVELDLSKMTRTASQLRLFYAVLKAANPDTFTLPFDQFTKALTLTELTDLSNAVAPAMSEFYHISKIAEQHVPEADTDEKEADAKNG